MTSTCNHDEITIILHNMHYESITCQKCGYKLDEDEMKKHNFRVVNVLENKS